MDAQGWQPIETAPKDGTAVLVWCDESDSKADPHFDVAAYVAYFGSDNGWYSDVGSEWHGDWSRDRIFPSFWMHLPPPPQKET